MTSGSPVSRARVAEIFVVLALTLLGGALRAWPIGSALPHRFHPDESSDLDALEYMRGDPEVVRTYTDYGVYPLLVPRLAWLIAPEPAQSIEPKPRDLAGHVHAASRDLVLLRCISALLSALIVPGTWLIARRFLERRDALLAAALAAVCVFPVWHSMWAKPHGPAAGFIALSIAGALAVRARGDARAYVLTGLAIGFAIGCSQASLAVVPALVAAHLLRKRPAPRRSLVWLLVAAALIFICAFVFCPRWFDGKPRPVVPVELHLGMFSGRGFMSVLLGLLHIDPLFLALTISGAVAWLIAGAARKREREAVSAAESESLLRRWLRGREDLAVVLIYVLPYAAFIALYDNSQQRYFLQLAPCAFCLAAGATGTAARSIARRLTGWKSIAIPTALPLVLVAVETALTLKMNSVLVAPDTAARAAEWIERNLAPASTRIAVMPGLDLPLLREPESRASGRYAAMKQTPWARHQRTLGATDPGAQAWQLFSIPLMSDEDRRMIREDTPAYLSRLRADYVVVELSKLRIVSGLVRNIRSACTPVARFSAMKVDDGDDTPFVLYWDQQHEYELGSSWLWKMLNAESFGAVVEIYRVGIEPRPRVK